jgi:hypothetical protein
MDSGCPGLITTDHFLFEIRVVLFAQTTCTCTTSVLIGNEMYLHNLSVSRPVGRGSSPFLSFSRVLSSGLCLVLEFL